MTCYITADTTELVREFIRGGTCLAGMLILAISLIQIGFQLRGKDRSGL